MPLEETPALWRFILSRLEVPPASSSIDSMHEAIGVRVVGRGTIQRIRAGSPIQLKSIEAIAERLGCDVADVIKAASGEELPAPAAPPRHKPTLTEALSVLGDALSCDMPPDIRQDAADLLAKMALRNGAVRQQTELVRLLASVNGTVLIPSPQIDVAHAMSPLPADDLGVPKVGDSDNSSRRGKEWAPPDIGRRVNKSGQPQGEQRDHYPGRTVQKTGKAKK